MASLSTLILAAGKGVRMKSKLPKVLHPVGGVPMVERVCQTVSQLKSHNIAVIVGHQGEIVQKALSSSYPKAKFYRQRSLNGSGGAVKAALSWLKRAKGDVIVTCGDAPLITAETFRSLVQTHKRQKNQVTVLSVRMPNPFGYGRIVRTRRGDVLKIVEELDATPFEKKLNEINSGTYCFQAKALAAAIVRIQNKNAKKEYYLTDTLEIIRKKGGRVGAAVGPDHREAQGINGRAQLAMAQQILFQRKAEQLMRDGVTLMDPGSTFVDESVKIGSDTVIWPNTFIRGASKIGSGCEIGPWTHIIDSQIENDARIKASFIESARVRTKAEVGPFSRVRPKSVVGPGARLGNFSEVKNAQLGPGAKVNHLSYLGDAKVGKNVNIGAGTITCNYDGFHKYPTVIQDHAFIGSNANLIAPIKIGSHSVIGAGSSLSQDVPPWSLAFERAPTRIKKGWARRKQKKK